MKNNINELFDTVINNDYCSGCGACSGVKDSPLNIEMNNNGKYIPVLNKSENVNTAIDVISVCPFSNRSRNESEIGSRIYKDIDGIKNSEYNGYYLKNYAGYVKSGEYREKGSSGGMGTWIASKLLNEDLVDGIIHVKSEKANKGETLFSYQISFNVQELSCGAKSKYYPVEMSKVIKYVRENPGRYALIGIPCFIKAIRLLSEKDDIINERIKYTIGLVCGHLKTDMFTKSMAWQMGIKPDELRSIDFRVKIEGSKASNYGVKVEGNLNGREIIKTSPIIQLYTTNWGHGLFKYKACDFCDDVLAETADITVGDAWLPEYVRDAMGTNIVIVRNPILLNLIESNKNELQLDDLSLKKIVDSQAGGFRHRREGLGYRLYLKDQKNEWRPNKRIEANNSISSKRKNIYEKRIKLYEESYIAFNKAVEKNDFKVFIEYMDPMIKEYNKLISKPFLFKVLGKIKRTILK